MLNLANVFNNIFISITINIGNAKVPKYYLSVCPVNTANP